MGATTVWERWDAIRPDGSIHDGVMHIREGEEGHMLSFNHYAYGAVLDWVFRTLAGLAPDPAVPGYRHVVLAPRPVAGIDHVDAGIETARGRVGVDWTTRGDTFTARYTVPFGVTATFDAPIADGGVFSVDGERATGRVTMGAGTHEVTVTGVQVVDPAVTSLS